MLAEKHLLMLPGPTPVPPQVALAQAMPMMNHRGEAFTALFREITAGLQRVFRTQQPVLVLPGSGTGGFETALQNFVAPGEKVLAVVTGAFGDRWAKGARALGYEVERLDVEWGAAVDPGALRERLATDRDRRVRAVLLTHNETSTGVTNPIRELAQVVREHGALVMVDSVSGLGALPLEMDEWGLDVVLTGAQKALMCPPGLTILAAGPRAWEASDRNPGPRFYFDLRPYRDGHEKASLPYTPALALLYALRESLRLIEKEGLEAAWARHRLLGRMTRAGVRAMGLELLARDERHASDSVTAVKAPPGLSAAAIRRTARERFGVILAGGQGPLSETVFRIGHLGYVVPGDVVQALTAVESALAVHGLPVELGRAAAAAQAVWLTALREESPVAARA